MRSECRLPDVKSPDSVTVVHATTLSAARGFSLSSLLLALSFLAACSAAKPQPLIFGDPVWTDGETSAYQVTNREGRVVGAAAFQVGRREQEEGWTLLREVLDAGASEQATIEMQPAGYRPVTSHLVRSFGSGKQIVETQFEGAQVDIELTNRQGAKVYQRVQVPSDIRDERTLLLIIRALPLTQGYATRINSFLPIAGQMERVAIQVRRSESVTVPAGTFEAWLVELKANDRTTKAWVAKAAPFQVVKFIDGRSQATFELTGFEQ